jgi:FixJ family two-component response regulator
VLDVNMPGVGGVAFKRALVAAGRDLPTIFITALEPNKVSESLAVLSPLAVLYKPFNDDDLLEAIGRARG